MTLVTLVTLLPKLVAMKKKGKKNLIGRSLGSGVTSVTSVTAQRRCVELGRRQGLDGEIEMQDGSALRRGFYRSRGGKEVYTTRREFRRKNDYPYGIWKCANGREVLFNWFMEPLWQRYPAAGGGFTIPELCVDPDERVDYITSEYIYFDRDETMSADYKVPEDYKLTLAKIALQDWGISSPYPANRWTLINRMRKREYKARELFAARWSRHQLEAVDPELQQALDEQHAMYVEGLNASVHQAEIHTAAMCRGWQAAVKRMEDEQIDRALAVFPGVTIRVREKPDLPDVD